MKLGIVQGRLSFPVENFIQNFPNDWENEFKLIDELGINFIEWLVNTKSFNEGKLNIDCKKYSNKISSIGCDNLTNKNIAEKDFLEEQLRPICNFATRNNIKSITIPLLEDSKIDNKVDRFIKHISIFRKDYPNIQFNFELESGPEIALELCKSNSNFYITYDIGNLTACQFDHEAYITKCFKYIETVHLKDKTIVPCANVWPGTGDANFDLVFKVLSKLNYNNKFVIQTSRGKDGKELNTIKKHKLFFESLYNKYYEKRIIKQI